MNTVKMVCGAVVCTVIPLAADSVQVSSGTLDLDEKAVAGVYPDTVTVNAADEITAVVFKNANDTVMTDVSVLNGSLIKRGAGSLTIESSTGTQIVNGKGRLSTAGTAPSDFGTFPSDGSSPVVSGSYGGFTVAEGELRLKGTSGAADFTVGGNSSVFQIGVRSTDGTAVPGLVLDNARVNAARAATGASYFISGFTPENSFCKHAYMYVTNGSEFRVESIFTGNATKGDNGYTFDMKIADKSVVEAKQKMSFAWVTAGISVTGGSKLLVGSEMPGDINTFHVMTTVAATFDASTLAAADPDGNGSPFMDIRNEWGKPLSFDFRNGSKLYCNRFIETKNNGYNTQFVFSDSEWIPSTGDFTFAFLHGNKTSIETDGGDLKLNPPEGALWRWAAPIKGTGGIAKGGAGELYIDKGEYYTDATWDGRRMASATTNKTGNASYACSGDIKVSQGTLRLAAGALLASSKVRLSSSAVLDLDGSENGGFTVAGTGTVRNGTLSDVMIEMTPDAAEHIVLASTAVIGGRVGVSFGRTSSNPLPDGTYVVARYEDGCVPALEKWSAVDSGGTARFTFAAADGYITVTVKNHETETVAVTEPGTLDVGSASALTKDGFYGGVLNLTLAAQTEALIIYADTDTEMIAPTINSGAVIKRGPGRVTFLHPEGTQIINGYGNAPEMYKDVNKDLGDFPEDGSVPDGGFGGLNIVEGELVLKGTGPSQAVFTALNGSKPHINICMTTEDGTVDPGLVLDNARLDLRDSNNDGNYLYFFSRLGSGGGYFSSRAYLAITNGSFLCSSVTVFPNCATTLNVDVLDNSVFMIQYCLLHRWTAITVNVRENSAFFAGNQFASVFGLTLSDLVTVNLDDSVFARTENLAPMKVHIKDYGGLVVNVANGSKLYLDVVRSDSLGLATKHKLELNFDDGEWNPQNDEYVFAYENNAPVIIRSNAGGLRLNPPVSGKTWRLATPVTGEGGIEKGGAGELYIDTREYYGTGSWVNTTPAYTVTNRTGEAVYTCDGPINVTSGNLRAAQGSLKDGTSVALSEGTVFDLDGGNHGNLVVSGTGTLRNGGVQTLTLIANVSEENGVCIDETASLKGTVYVDFCADEDSPVPYGTYAIAAYSGAAPETMNWKALNLGERNMGAVFTASDGKVYATVKKRGFIVTLK